MIGLHNVPIIMWTKEKKQKTNFWDWLTVDVPERFAFATYTEAVALLLFASFECASKVFVLSNSTRAIIVLWANRFTFLQTHFQCVHFSKAIVSNFVFLHLTFSNASTLTHWALAKKSKNKADRILNKTTTTKNIKGPKCEYIFLSPHANIISNNLTCKSMINGAKNARKRIRTERKRREADEGYRKQHAHKDHHLCRNFYTMHILSGDGL